MKVKSTFLYAVVLLILLISDNVKAQNVNSKKILGCWEIVNVKSDNDADVDFAKESIGATICFKANGKFTTKFQDVAEEVSGTYTLSKDGKTLFQTRDEAIEGIDQDAEIRKLTEKYLEFEAGGTVFSLKKAEKPAR